MLVKVAIPKQIQFKMVPNFSEMLLRGQQEVHYIGGSEVLPPPLEPEEELEAIEQLDSKDCANAKAKLIEHNLRLVVYIAKKFDNTGVGVEDLISIGTIGLIKSINTFNSFLILINRHLHIFRRINSNNTQFLSPFIILNRSY